MQGQQGKQAIGAMPDSAAAGHLCSTVCWAVVLCGVLAAGVQYSPQGRRTVQYSGQATSFGVRLSSASALAVPLCQQHARCVPQPCMCLRVSRRYVESKNVVCCGVYCRKRETLTGDATIRYFDYLEGFDAFEGVPANLFTEISTSKERSFAAVDFVDTPGLVDGDMKVCLLCLHASVSQCVCVYFRGCCCVCVYVCTCTVEVAGHQSQLQLLTTTHCAGCTLCTACCCPAVPVHCEGHNHGEHPVRARCLWEGLQSVSAPRRAAVATASKGLLRCSQIC
jgi:hypothetical protein